MKCIDIYLEDEIGQKKLEENTKQHNKRKTERKDNYIRDTKVLSLENT